MPENHLDRATLERFLALELTARDLRAATWHLSLCDRCRDALRGLAPSGELLLQRFLGDGAPAVADGGDYEAAFAAARRVAVDCSEALAAERQAASPAVAELLALPRRRRWARLRSSPALWSFAVGEALVSASRRLWTDDNRGAEELAQLALAVADRVAAGGPAPGRRAAVEDLRAEAWAAIGTARRLASDLRGAGEAFAAAAGHLRGGSGEPLVGASVLGQVASLRRAQRRFDDAEHLLTRVLALYRRVGDRHLQGRTLVHRALLQNYRGDAEASIRTLRRAAGLIDARREPRLFLVARHNLLNALVDADRFEEAAALLPEVRELVRRLGKRSDPLVLDWVEGRLAAGRRRYDEAQRLLSAVRRGFIREGNGFDAALVSLDLAASYLEAGRPGPVRRLALEALPIFESRDVHREASAALALFQQAVAAETATAAMVRDLARRLRRTGDAARVPLARPS